MASYSALNEEELKDLIGYAPETPISDILKRLEDGTAGGVATMMVPVHIITETTEVETFFHARIQAMKDKKIKSMPHTKTWTKMVVCMETNGQGLVLLFDDVVAVHSSTRMLENALELGKPFLLLPNRRLLFFP